MILFVENIVVGIGHPQQLIVVIFEMLCLNW